MASKKFHLTHLSCFNDALLCLFVFLEECSSLKDDEKNSHGDNNKQQQQERLMCQDVLMSSERFTCEEDKKLRLNLNGKHKHVEIY